MSNVLNSTDYQCDDSFEIEAKIRAARNYVVPSSNLRPQTLEAARELSEDRKSTRQLRRLAVAMLLLSVLSIPMADQLTVWHQRQQLPSASELQQRALDMESDGDAAPHWGLIEAFNQLRRVQAARLGQASPNRSVQ